MRRIGRVLVAVAVGIVNLLPHARPCWAGETTPVWSTTGELYAGLGVLEVENNEGDAPEYRDRHLGVGLLAELRPWPHAADSPLQPRGAVFSVGVTGELRANRLLACNYWCTDERPGYFLDPIVGLRLGAGFDWSLFGLRGGALVALPPADARIAEAMLVPDVQLRFGSLSAVWGELGLGAYDAATVLRPGTYVGLGVAATRSLSLRAHYGLHAGLGSFGHTVLQLGSRFDAGFHHALSSRLAWGLGGAHQSNGLFDQGTWEARSELRVVW